MIRQHWINRLLFLIIILLGNGCTEKSSSNEHQQNANQSIIPDTTETVVADTPKYVQPNFRIDSFRQAAYSIFTVHPIYSDIRIFNRNGKDSIHNFSSVYKLATQEEKDLLFITNGGMFTQDRTAKGLLIENGKIIKPIDRDTSGYGNFYMQPNGILAIDSMRNGHIVPTQHFDSLMLQHSIQYATQSGPMMIMDSTINDKFTDGSKNKYVRNGVGLTNKGEFVFIISREEVSFYDISAVLLSAGCRQALYLDGFVSRFYVPEHDIGALEDGNRLGPLIAIFE